MILIAYASKTGHAQEAAERLATLLPSADLVDLTQGTPQIGSYDAVIIGSGVRMGAIHKTVKEILEKNKEELSSKRFAFYISNCFAENANDIINAGVAEDLRNSAVWIGSVGGWLDPQTLKGLDKVIAKAAAKAVKEGQVVNERLDDAALKELAACFKV